MEGGLEELRRALERKAEVKVELPQVKDLPTDRVSDWEENLNQLREKLKEVPPGDLKSFMLEYSGRVEETRKAMEEGKAYSSVFEHRRKVLMEIARTLLTKLDPQGIPDVWRQVPKSLREGLVDVVRERLEPLSFKELMEMLGELPEDLRAHIEPMVANKVEIPEDASRKEIERLMEQLDKLMKEPDSALKEVLSRAINLDPSDFAELVFSRRWSNDLIPRDLIRNYLIKTLEEKGLKEFASRAVSIMDVAEGVAAESERWRKEAVANAIADVLEMLKEKGELSKKKYEEYKARLARWTGVK